MVRSIHLVHSIHPYMNPLSYCNIYTFRVASRNTNIVKNFLLSDTPSNMKIKKRKLLSFVLMFVNLKISKKLQHIFSLVVISNIYPGKAQPLLVFCSLYFSGGLFWGLKRWLIKLFFWISFQFLNSKLKFFLK